MACVRGFVAVLALTALAVCPPATAAETLDNVRDVFTPSLPGAYQRSPAPKA